VALSAWAAGGNPLVGDASLYSDLLGWAVQNVDWVEVARALGPEEWERATSSSPSGVLETIIDLAAGDDGLPIELQSAIDDLRFTVKSRAKRRGDA
jgi:hypothetical protein